MCGIAVVVNGTNDELLKMAKGIHHRGKYHSTYEVNNIKAAFAYLPITDGSAPIQPYKSKTYTLWFNGFISNYRELSAKYDIKLKTNCDTELLGEFIERFQFTKLHELNGFFAIVVYDGVRIHCFTDRYGIKQLYKYIRNNTVYIASEVKAILEVFPDLEFDAEGVNDWKYSLGIMNPHTVYNGIKRVACLPHYMPDKIEIDYEKAKDTLMLLWLQSVNRNKVTGISDGVFLSGGIDSGTIARFFSPQFSFSMDYVMGKFSEAENIKHNSTGIHYSMICNESLYEKYKHLALQAVDDFKAGSCYTNFALTELASKHCTVLYSGAGGDEVFNGYTHRYNKNINDVIRRTDLLPDRNYSLTHKQYDWLFLKGVLVIEDRMSGWHTMETRYPFLDNDLVDFALSLPDEYLNEKRILKDICGLHTDVTNAKKKGFSNPFATNADWVKFVLSKKMCMNTDIYNPYSRFHESNQIHDTAIIYDCVELGKNNVIGPYAVIGSNGEVRDCKAFMGTVEIGDGNVISEMVTIQRPAAKGAVTKIGSDNIIMAHTHIGHDATVGDNCELSTGTIVGGYAEIKNGAKVKLGVTIRNRKTIGENATVGMGAVVVSNVQAETVVIGNPAKPFISKHAEIKRA